MAVKRGKLEFHNVVVMKTRSAYGEWEEKAQQFRYFLVSNDIFITGPIMLRWDNVDKEQREADLSIYVPTYQKMQMEENDVFFYLENFLIEDGLKIRHTDMSDNLSGTEEILQIMAEKAELKLCEPYYYIYLPVFQEYVIDIFAQIEEDGK